jgi:hypothetical protein
MLLWLIVSDSDKVFEACIYYLESIGTKLLNPCPKDQVLEVKPIIRNMVFGV